MKTIRAGVIGVGHLGYHHARIYAALEGVQLVGVVDRSLEHAMRASADFGAPFFMDASELLAQGVDAVSVVVPTSAHKEVALQCIAAGVDVLVEKPIAATIDEAEAIVNAAAKHGRLVQVGHIERFNGAVVALMEAVKNPRFIECHRLSPYPNRGDDVSVVLDLMIHDLEILLALVGSNVAQVDAVGVPVFSKFEDIANARIRFESGCVANVTSSRVSMEKMRKIRIFASDAYVSTDYSAQEVIVYRKKPIELTPDITPMELIDIEPLEVHKEEPLKRELASFISCARDRSRPLVSGEDALAALRLAQRVVDSIRAGALREI
ncbi:MAG TPA: Gfo/Idh/MocA family oxidoreductase [Candidatus Hydrogenedentes bacterium]|nr:Gfo/Idh/MocA family oxidoreductase [Candidatus Hydrogenedentota bacterium]HRK33140.1 Gfo/Idh/MocA family oxidoreductase [Candidatus Hydrogenedentota bacterium]